MAKPKMTQAEQAVLLWPMLALAARTQQVLTYSDVAGFTAIEARGLDNALGRIHAYCKRRGFPLLNSIVVQRGTGVPGEGFPDKMTPTQTLVEQAKVFTFDWSARGANRVRKSSARQGRLRSPRIRRRRSRFLRRKGAVGLELSKNLYTLVRTITGFIFANKLDQANTWGIPVKVLKDALLV